MEAKVTWKDNLHFNASAGSGATLLLASGGESDGFSPMELVAVSLAGCTAMDVISVLQKKKQAVTEFEVKVTAERVQTEPRIFSHMLVEYIVTGHDVDIHAVERAVELSTTKYCSVQAMLGKAVPIEHKITLQQAQTEA
jgi:putative redox protein